jgi:hypothetical protein
MHKVYAPFTQEQISYLNGYQQCALYHPFTCGIDSNHPNLVAYEGGWKCTQEGCNYHQDYAFGFMADGTWQLNAACIGD